MVKRLCILILAAASACSVPQQDTQKSGKTPSGRSQPDAHPADAPQTGEEIGRVILPIGLWMDGTKRLKPGSPIYEGSQIKRHKREKPNNDSITLRAFGSKLLFACSNPSNCPEPLPLQRQPKEALLFPDPVTHKYRPALEISERFLTTGDRAVGDSSPVEAVLIRNSSGLALTDAIPQGIKPGEVYVFCPAAEDGSSNCGQLEDPRTLRCEAPGSALCSIQPPPGLNWLRVFQRNERYGRTVYDIIDGRKALVLVLDPNPGIAVKNEFREFTAQLKKYAGEQQSQDQATHLRMYLYEAWYGRER
jgi:hypothetical protein